MKIKLGSFFLMMLGIIGCNMQTSSKDQTDKLDYAKLSVDDFGKREVRLNLLRDYAVCSCIYAGSKRNNSFKDDISFSVLADIANFSPDVYAKVDSFMVDFVSKIPESQIADYDNKKPILFRCVSLYRTETLDSLVEAASKL